MLRSLLSDYAAAPAQMNGLLAANMVATASGPDSRFPGEQRAHEALPAEPGFVVTDREGRIQYLNSVAEALTGWSLHEAQGCLLTAVLLLVHKRTGRLFINFQEMVRQNQASADLPSELCLLSPGIEPLPVEGGVTVREENGKVVGTTVHFRGASCLATAEPEAHWSPLCAVPGCRLTMPTMSRS